MTTTVQGRDMDLFAAIRSGQTNLATIDAPKETLTKYLSAALKSSDTAFLEAVESGVPLPTQEHDIESLASTAYNLGSEKSIDCMKPIISKELLSTLLNQSIAHNYDSPLWCDDSETLEYHQYRLRLLRDGAIFTENNVKLIHTEMYRFQELSGRLHDLLYHGNVPYYGT